MCWDQSLIIPVLLRFPPTDTKVRLMGDSQSARRCDYNLHVVSDVMHGQIMQFNDINSALFVTLEMHKK